MVRKFLYSYDEGLKVLFKYYYGTINLDDIRESWEHAFANDLIPHGTKAFVIDYRQAILNIPIAAAYKIAEFYRNNEKYFKDARVAVITDRPDQVVFPTLVEQLDDGYATRPFYSPEAAIKWATG